MHYGRLVWQQLCTMVDLDELNHIIQGFQETVFHFLYKHFNSCSGRKLLNKEAGGPSFGLSSY